MKKIAIISHVVPPMSSGQAVILGRLIEHIPTDKLVFLANHRAKEHIDLIQKECAYKTYHLPRDLPTRRYINQISLLPSTLLRALRIVKILKQEHCELVLICSGDILDIPAGCLAGILTNTPYVIYFFDDYIYQWTDFCYRLFASISEKLLIRGAAVVIVPNEFLQAEYQKRYNILPVMIRNAFRGILSKNSDAFFDHKEEDISIAYTGAIYHVNYDVIRTLLSAITKMNKLRIRLHVYTDQPQLALIKAGITGDVVFHQHKTPAEILEVQRNADILYLPLGFATELPELIRTSAPGKIAEYLASDTPILVHAPADSFISWYFQKNDCGLTINKNDENEIQNAITLLHENKVLAQRIVANARRMAQQDFRLEDAQNKFQNLLAGVC